jgi:uncharacterized protein YfaT (DUF1175 family)
VRHGLNSPSSIFLSAAFLIGLIAGSLGLSRIARSVPAMPSRPNHPAPSIAQTGTWTDRWGDGLPDTARLDSEQDREDFVRWVTYLAELQYYRPAPEAHEEIDDCAALVRFAYRNALAPHTAAWRHSMNLSYDPGFKDIMKFVYPEWPLGRGLFRVQPGPFVPYDIDRGAFGEFADAGTLLHYNSFFISRNIRAARPGDLLFYHQPGERQPFHSMIFIGPSYFQPRGLEWIVYHTGDLNGHRGEIREVEVNLLARHPDAHWRPIEANPRFLGVYRFELLR